MLLVKAIALNHPASTSEADNCRSELHHSGFELGTSGFELHRSYFELKVSSAELHHSCFELQLSS